MKLTTNYMRVLVFVVIFILSMDVILPTIQNEKLKTTIRTYFGTTIEPLKSGDQVKPFKAISMSRDTVISIIVFTDKSNT